ncbi:oxidoreductase, zinc-binding [Luminiphilus syltensis NOR5-1B]|uniref:Oxidoreductase, zinc-binding n=1 Tax=Luminiphilus syltensis NOR5-1B TaxID=565045 RepID=B8KSN7_9GAMM|nr:NADP-dependent oxidoreductase [Luminiphilus syltensis]EED35771.1 oxidoreductase, zinc-binding [Luminiphilus syltensis NOR5-1B]
MLPTSKRQWTLAKRPHGVPSTDEVTIEEKTIGELPPGHLLVENHYFSLDPAIRGWMSDAPSYLPPIPLGEPVRSTVCGKVLASTSDGFAKGDLVYGMGAWETHGVVPAEFFTKVPEDNTFPLHYYVNMLGAVGLTPYFGVIEAGKAQAGQTMLMSAAAGAVGSIGGQIARLMGLRVVGMAGSDEKCRWVTDELGFDDCINYKTCGDMVDAIAKACPEGVDLFFDNVGGEILDAALMNLNSDAIIVFCGAISSYNATEPVPGPYNWWQVLARSVTIQGYLIKDYFDRFPEGQAQMSEWLNEGKIQFKEHMVDGFDNTLDAFSLLFSGGNEGKLMVKLEAAD